MALQTTLFEAVKAANYLQFAGRNVIDSYLPYFDRGKLHLSLGQDDDWFLSDQQIKIDESGEAQVQLCGWGDVVETKPMRFLMSRPLNGDDLKKREDDLPKMIKNG